MHLKLFVLPIKNLGAAEAEMNAFLRGHRVLAVKKEFVADGENSFWSFCVKYLDSGGGGGLLPGGKLPKVDYKEVLKPEDFEVFSRLRVWRKSVAEKEGVPVYVVLTNEQLDPIGVGESLEVLQAIAKQMARLSVRPCRDGKARAQRVHENMEWNVTVRRNRVAPAARRVVARGERTG